MSTKIGASAAAAADHPSTVTGVITTKIAITSRAAVRRPALPRRVPLWCSRYSAKGAAASTAAMTPKRTAYP